MANPDPPPRTTQFLLLSIPRSGCHLLDRTLSKQSNAEYIFHPYLDCLEPKMQWMHNGDCKDAMNSDLFARHEAGEKKGLKAWQEALKKAESEGKILMNHSHPIHAISPSLIRSYLHDTKSPPLAELEPIAGANDLLLHPGTVPVFTIRDPRLVVASGWRKLGPMGAASRIPIVASTSPVFSRTMYDWYVAHGVTPIVVDADDYMTSEDFIRKLCREAGLNENEAWLKWPPETRKDNMTAEQEPMWDLLQQTLHHSSGLDPSRAAKNMNMDEEQRKWKEEFGPDGWALTSEAVRRQMPHYKYLYEKRMTL